MQIIKAAVILVVAANLTSAINIPVSTKPKSVTDQLLDAQDGIPECARNCEVKLLKIAGCAGPNDYKCLCKAQSKEVEEQAESCVIGSCWNHPLDLKKVKPALAHVCDVWRSTPKSYKSELQYRSLSNSTVGSPM